MEGKKLLEVIFLGLRGSIHSEDSQNSSLIVKTNEASILVDVSSSLYKALDEKVTDIVLTHEHIDHIYALPSFLHQAWLLGRKEPINVHADPEILKYARKMIDLFSLESKKGIFSINLIPLKEFKREGLTITPIKSDHTEYSYGLLFDYNGFLVLYTSDTRPLNRTLLPKKVDILITEASGLSKDEENLYKKGHQSAREAALLAKDLNASKLFILHLPKEKEESDLIEKEAKNYFSNSFIPKLIDAYKFEC